jgi:hypothetical protein
MLTFNFNLSLKFIDQLSVKNLKGSPFLFTDEFRQYAGRKPDYPYVFRRQEEEEKKSATKLQVCDYNNANNKTKAE